MNQYYISKIARLEKFSIRLRRMIDSGRFKRLSGEKRNKLIKRVSRLYEQLSHLKEVARFRRVLAMASLILAFCTSAANAQVSFAPPAQPAGWPDTLSTYDYGFVATADIDGDGDVDLFHSGGYDSVFYYQNTGTTTSASFGTQVSYPFNMQGSVDEYTFLDFVDIDNDGDQDAFYGGADSASLIMYQENIGTAMAPDYGSRQSNPFGIADTVNKWVIPSFADLDNDGDFDMMLIKSAYYDHKFYYIENTGTPSTPNFSGLVANPFGIIPEASSLGLNADFADLDMDGDLDMMVSGYDTSTYNSVFVYYENTGSVSAPSFASPVRDPFGLSTPPTEYMVHRFEDMDADGDMDIVASGVYGSLWYYENTSPVTITEPDPDFSEVQIYPNPTNRLVNINLNGSIREGMINVKNVLGKAVISKPISGRQVLDLEGHPDGVYFITISYGETQLTRRVVLH